MIEQKLGQRLLPLACILECKVEKFFESLIERSRGPNIKLFQRFRESWHNIDASPPKYSMGDDIVQSAFADDYEAIVKFIRGQLHEQQVRDDYKELLTLSTVFLGEPEAKSVHINSPRAYHRAIGRVNFKKSWKSQKGLVKKICLFTCRIKIYQQKFFKIWPS